VFFLQDEGATLDLTHEEAHVMPAQSLAAVLGTPGNDEWGDGPSVWLVEGLDHCDPALFRLDITDPARPIVHGHPESGGALALPYQPAIVHPQETVAMGSDVLWVATEDAIVGFTPWNPEPFEIPVRAHAVAAQADVLVAAVGSELVGLIGGHDGYHEAWTVPSDSYALEVEVEGENVYAVSETGGQLELTSTRLRDGGPPVNLALAGTHLVGQGDAVQLAVDEDTLAVAGYNADGGWAIEAYRSGTGGGLELVARHTLDDVEFIADLAIVGSRVVVIDDTERVSTLGTNGSPIDRWSTLRPATAGDRHLWGWSLASVGNHIFTSSHTNEDSC
jgi:hypothetical protein